MTQFRFSRRPDIGDKVRVSFEFFPPKTDEMEARLWDTVTRLEPLRPQFVSVTYGAGGSTRERTARTVRRILNESSLTPAAHLTCVDATRDEVDQVIAEFAEMGVKRFVALRGDPAEGVGARYRPHPGGYANGAELVGALKACRRFRHFGRGLSGKASGKPGFRDRHRHAEAQGRQWRDAGHHPVLLRQRPLRALRRAGAARRHLYSDRARHPAGAQFRAGRQFLVALRRACAGLAGRALRWAGQRTRRRMRWWRRRSRPSRCWTWSSAASAISISTR